MDKNQSRIQEFHRQLRSQLGCLRLQSRKPDSACTDHQIIGTKRPYEDGRFGTKDGKAQFMATAWRGLTPNKNAERSKFPYLINNGRANHVWPGSSMPLRANTVGLDLPGSSGGTPNVQGAGVVAHHCQFHHSAPQSAHWCQ